MSTATLARNLPEFTLEEVQGLVRDLWGLEGDYRQLTSERDLSYRIRDARGEGFVVKISNAAEPDGVVDLQVSVLQHIAEVDPELPVPRMVATGDGKAFDRVADTAGNSHMIRLLTFLEGDVKEQTPAAMVDATRYNVGAMMGRMARAMRNFWHPYADKNVHLWDIKRSLQLRPMIEHLPELELRQLCHAILDHAERFTFPRMKKFTRWQVVHQDAHAGNVLVDPEDPTAPVGIIDFGDMTYSSILCEIAVAADSFTEFCEDPVGNLAAAAAGFDSTCPLEEEEVNLLYDVALVRMLNNAVIIGARAETGSSDDGHLPPSPKFARLLRAMWDEGQESAIRRLREALRFPVYSPATEGAPRFIDDGDTLYRKRRDRLGDVWHFYDQPLHFTRGEGPWLYTADGTAFLDCYNNVQQVGHANPHVARAIARQASVLNINTRYLCDIVADYAERLTRDLPPHLDACIFVNSGSEANDIAFQIASFASGHRGAIVMEDAYHGCTQTSMELSPIETGRFDHIEYLQVPDTYRGPHAGDPAAAEKYAADADRAIADLAARGHQPAAFMVDTALCSNGVIMAPDTYFDRVAQTVRAAGGLVIADEVQAGLGRLGSFWGFEAQGLAQVDIVTMGKPVGNGHPLGVIITSRELIDRFAQAIDLFSTFGGNPVSCAAGMAVLDEIERRDLVGHSQRTGDYFRARLRELAERQPLIGEVVGKGMVIGVDFVTDHATKAPASNEVKQLIELMRQEHILIGKSGRLGNRLKLRPNFAWQAAQVDLFVDRLEQCLKMIAR